jgi:hypothetical protein
MSSLLIHTAVCLTTVPQPLPQPVLHTVRSSASSFSLHYPLVSFKVVQYLHTFSSSSSRHFNSPSLFPSLMCFIMQFLHKMWPIQLAFLLFTVYRIFLSFLTVHNTSQAVIILHLNPAHNWDTPLIGSKPKSFKYKGLCRYFSKCQWSGGVRRESAVNRFLELRVRILPWIRMPVSRESYTHYQADVSAMGRSLVQSSATDCGVSLCVIQKPLEWGGPALFGLLCQKKNIRKNF